MAGHCMSFQAIPVLHVPWCARQVYMWDCETQAGGVIKTIMLMSPVVLCLNVTTTAALCLNVTQLHDMALDCLRTNCFIMIAAPMLLKAALALTAEAGYMLQ